MNESYWEVNDDEYEVIDMEEEERLCNELITKKQAFRVIADSNSSTKMTLACYDELLDGIATARAIEAEPVRHGHWEKLYDRNYKCSVCGAWYEADKEEILDFDYCPHCGAKMDEVTE